MRAGYATNPRRYRYLHVAIAEKALGKPLPKGAVVHHIDGNRLNNKPSNLLVCPDQTYHMLTCQLVLDKDLFSFERSWDGRAAACRSCTNARRRGKGYGKWTLAKKLAQQIRRAARRTDPCISS